MAEKERMLKVLKEMEEKIKVARAAVEAENYPQAAGECAKLAANLGEFEEKVESALS